MFYKTAPDLSDNQATDIQCHWVSIGCQDTFDLSVCLLCLFSKEDFQG